MFLTFTTGEPDGTNRNYSWWFSTMEAAFEVLSALVAKGRLIVEAELLDEPNRLRLDVDAFDGESFLHPMTQLQDQWQALLAVPMSRCQDGLNQTTRPMAGPAKASGGCHWRLPEGNGWG